LVSKGNLSAKKKAGNFKEKVDAVDEKKRRGKEP